VFTTNALKFLKVYLVTFGLILTTVFNETTKEVEINVYKNENEQTIKLDDFTFDSQKTDVKINKCLAKIKENNNVLDETLYRWLPSNQDYYNTRSSNLKSEENGFEIDPNQFIVLGSEWPDYHLVNQGGDHYLDIRITNATLQKIKSWSSTGTPRYWFWIPKNDQFIFSSRTDKWWETISRVGVGAFNPLADVLFETARYPENPSAGKDVYLQEHTYTDFGQGWFEGYINNISLPTSTWIRLRISLKNNVSTTFIESVLAKTIIANPLVIGSKDDFIVDANFDIYDQNWYLRPTIDLTELDLPYGYAVKTTDGVRTKYWQLGQVPREPQNTASRTYYLGKDNEIYEEIIAASNQIFPIQQKIIEDEFLYKAQFNAIYELVNSRYNQNVTIKDDSSINPLELSSLGLNAKITVYDKMNQVAILPISEIEIKNGVKKVKLGFKKTLFTEVIKS